MYLDKRRSFHHSSQKLNYAEGTSMKILLFYPSLMLFINDKLQEIGEERIDYIMILTKNLHQDKYSYYLKK